MKKNVVKIFKLKKKGLRFLETSKFGLLRLLRELKMYLAVNLWFVLIIYAVSEVKEMYNKYPTAKIFNKNKEFKTLKPYKKFMEILEGREKFKKNWRSFKIYSR